jgi:hypothetical protein
VGTLGPLRATLLALVLALAFGAAAAADTAPVATVTSVGPRAVYFGDRVTATLRIVVDPARVDAHGLTVDFPVTLYRPAGPPTVTRTGVGATQVVTYVWSLECLRRFCLPSAQRSVLSLPTATVRYRLRQGGTGTATAGWPPIVLGSRITAADVRTRALRNGLDALPAATPARSRSSIVEALSLLAGVFAAVSLGLVWLARPRLRRRADVLTPLERALREVERAAAGSSGDRRRTALDGLARVLDSIGDRGLATDARRLAWKEEEPSTESIHALLAAVRDELRASA